MTTCQIDGCGSAVLARGWCSKHWQRWRKRGNPETVHRAPGQRKLRGTDHPLWTEHPVYETAHRRVSSARGWPETHLCHGCGERTAQEWAYMHTDPDPLICAKRNAEYSGDPKYYDPMCRSCHRSFDAQRARAGESVASRL